MACLNRSNTIHLKLHLSVFTRIDQSAVAYLSSILYVHLTYLYIYVPLPARLSARMFLSTCLSVDLSFCFLSVRESASFTLLFISVNFSLFPPVYLCMRASLCLLSVFFSVRLTLLIFMYTRLYQWAFLGSVVNSSYLHPSASLCFSVSIFVI